MGVVVLIGVRKMAQHQMELIYSVLCDNCTNVNELCRTKITERNAITLMDLSDANDKINDITEKAKCPDCGERHHLRITEKVDNVKQL